MKKIPGYKSFIEPIIKRKVKGSGFVNPYEYYRRKLFIKLLALKTVL